MLIVANCLAIVASISSFVLSLMHIWKGNPSSPSRKKRRVLVFIGLSLLSAGLLIFLSLRLKYNIETLEQTGSFNHYSQGIQEVFYPSPYQSPPNLSFEIGITSHYPSSGPLILEQRSDGFKVKLDLNSFQYNWKAVGIQKR